MLVGVATRQYARSLEPLGAEMESRGTSKSAVSRRFVARTMAQLAAWQSAPLDGLDLVALLIDGVHLGDHCLIVALGIAADGHKHALGLWDGSTENATVCQGLLANLQKSRAAHRPQRARDPRRLEGAAQSGARDLRRGRARPAVPSALCRPPDYADAIDHRLHGRVVRVRDVGIIQPHTDR
ncbi:MAG TPA: transposase, partial [Vicinamibacterales bacterium]|nr:transposase [Vicinamibacterales bacterium]